MLTVFALTMKGTTNHMVLESPSNPFNNGGICAETSDQEAEQVDLKSQSESLKDEGFFIPLIIMNVRHANFTFLLLAFTFTRASMLGHMPALLIAESTNTSLNPLGSSLNSIPNSVGLLIPTGSFCRRGLLSSCQILWS